MTRAFFFKLGLLSVLVAGAIGLQQGMVTQAASFPPPNGLNKPNSPVLGAGNGGQKPGLGQISKASSAIRKVVPAKSNLSFHVIKDDAVTVHGAMGVTGSVSAKGEIELTVDLSTISTGVEPRDNNIKTTFFEVATAAFSKAQVKATLSNESMTMVRGGTALMQDLDGQLTLHGMTAPFKSKVFLSPLKSGGFRAISAQPVEIHMDTWGLAGRLTALMEICGHKAVAKPAQVTFDLVLE